MYVLEHMIYRGADQRPQYFWKAYAFCGKRRLLDKVRKAQTEPKHWRIIHTALTIQQYRRDSLPEDCLKAS